MWRNVALAQAGRGSLMHPLIWPGIRTDAGETDDGRGELPLSRLAFALLESLIVRVSSLRC